jgi:hypothetical protein
VCGGYILIAAILKPLILTSKERKNSNSWNFVSKKWRIILKNKSFGDKNLPWSYVAK